MRLSVVLFLILTLLSLAGCQFPHYFEEDPELYSVFERCGNCGSTYDGGWHLGYQQFDPDEIIDSIENDVLRDIDENPTLNQ